MSMRAVILLLLRGPFITMSALILLAPPSLAFGGAFRGAAARNIFLATSNSLASSSSKTHVSAVRTLTHPPSLSSHRALPAVHQRRNFAIYGRASFSINLNACSSIPLPESFQERTDDVTVAILSVFAACRVTRHVQPTSSKGIDVVSKQDASPVTIGDFASQALALQVLHNNSPSDMFIAEEGSDALQKDEDLLRKVWEATNHVGGGMLGKEQLLSAIDYGQGVYENSNKKQQTKVSNGRVWCLDPIDGTKGFLRGRVEGGQYCIALALIEDGEPVLSVLGCPNLPMSSTPATTSTPYGLWSDEEVRESEEHYPSSTFSSSRGCMFVAVRGGGCYEMPLHVIENMASDDKSTTDVSSTYTWSQLYVTSNNDTASKPTSQATFCLGVERSFSDPNGTILKIAQIIHGPNALTPEDDGGAQDIKNSLRLDGQGKYGLLARGDAECFLRLPKEGYVDWVWDVAPGYLILKEAGGTMTDVQGQPVDFSKIGGVERRAKLPDHVEGILGSCGGALHDALVEAHAEVASKI